MRFLEMQISKRKETPSRLFEMESQIIHTFVTLIKAKKVLTEEFPYYNESRDKE
jgi:hypothetical protein